MRRPTIPLTILALVGATLAALHAPPAGAAPDRELAQKKATWTSSMSGMPTSNQPGRQLKRVDFRVHYDWEDNEATIDAEVQLKGSPQDNPDSKLLAGVGRMTGGNCNLETLTTSRVWAQDGTEVRQVWESGIENASTTWNCGVVAIYDATVTDYNSATPFDATGGSLTNVYVTPRLKINAVEVLGKSPKLLKLVRGATQSHHVTVRNSGGLAAKGVVVTGTGKGIKVKKTKVGLLEPGESTTVRVPITLKGAQRSTTVKLKVKGSGATATRKLKVRRIAPPARPAAGKWKGGDFTFTVKNGKITGFRGIGLRMTCSPPLQFPTYRNVTLNFPTTKVPKHGIVDATKSWRQGEAWYTVSLRGKIVGKRITNARFSYFTAGSCSVIENFTARRK